VNPARHAVIGGGIIGCAIAWRLAQRGQQVTLFEKARLGQEASWAAAGMLSPGGELDQDLHLAAFYLESRRQYGAFVAELAEESGVPVDFRECGAIDLAYSSQEWDAIKTRALKQRAVGIASRELSADRIKTFSPHIETENLAGALFYPDDAIVAPRDVLAALSIAGSNRGVELREETPVHDIEVVSEGVRVNGEPFRNAVLAAGAWSSSITVNGVAPVPSSEPVKGHLLGYELQLGACPTIVRHEHIYVFQRGSGMVIAGASMENAGFEKAVDAAVSEQLRQDVTRVLPVLEKLQPVDIWTGLRPKSSTLQLGRWQNSNLLLAYGHFRNGILLAPATAQRIVAELAL
jgi:glycine oxidase